MSELIREYQDSVLAQAQVLHDILTKLNDVADGKVYGSSLFESPATFLNSKICAPSLKIRNCRTRSRRRTSWSTCGGSTRSSRR